MSSDPLVSLLVPCYNAAPFLPRLMESVRAQTRPFTTILCYDDGSTDDTAVARSLGLEIMTGQPNAGVAIVVGEKIRRNCMILVPWSLGINICHPRLDWTAIS